MVQIDIDNNNIEKIKTFIELNDLNCSIADVIDILIEEAFEEWKNHIKSVC
jgi:hypothetical protein